MLDTLGVVALVAATPLFLLLLRLAVNGREPTRYPVLQVAAGLLMLVTIAGLHLGITHWLAGSRWRDVRAVRWCLLSLPALTMLAGFVAIGATGWGWLVTVAGVLLLCTLWRSEWSRWSQVLAVTTEAGAAGEAIHEVRGSAPSDPSDASSLGADAGESGVNEQVRQRIERRVVEGREFISVWQRLEFPAFARATTLHIPFWPPLAAKPSVESEILCEVGAQVTIEQVELHGCRVKVQLEEADERPQQAELEIVFTQPKE